MRGNKLILSIIVGLVLSLFSFSLASADYGFGIGDTSVRIIQPINYYNATVLNYTIVNNVNVTADITSNITNTVLANVTVDLNTTITNTVTAIINATINMSGIATESWTTLLLDGFNNSYSKWFYNMTTPAQSYCDARILANYSAIQANFSNYYTQSQTNANIANMTTNLNMSKNNITGIDYLNPFGGMIRMAGILNMTNANITALTWLNPFGSMLRIGGNMNMTSNNITGLDYLNPMGSLLKIGGNISGNYFMGTVDASNITNGKAFSNKTELDWTNITNKPETFYEITAADLKTTNITHFNQTLFTIPLAANTNYTIDCTIWTNSSVTTVGDQLNMTFPASPTQNLITFNGAQTASTYLETDCYNPTGTTCAFMSLSSDAIPSITTITQRIWNVNAGNEVINMKAEAAGTAIAYRGSYCIVNVIA